jgi:hypothetical protein
LAVKTVQRSAGRSATAAAAYRHAERIECHREGRVHDYRAKQGVEHSFLVVPEDAPAWAHDRAALWNAAEAREARVNSITAREWELALPAELDADGRRLLVAGFAAELVARYGVAADVAIHAPHREGDQRNWHAHVLTTTRALTQDGLTDKTRVLDVKQTGGPEIALMRERWAEMQNHALERHGLEERVDHRSLVAQREAALTRGDELAAEQLDRAAEVKLGPAVSAVERREQRLAEEDGHAYVPLTERGTQVHEARQARSLLQELAQVRERLREAVQAQVQELHERAERAHETYTHAREDGTDRIRAGLAALRAAAQKHGIGHGQEHGEHRRTHGLAQGLGHSQERDDEARHERAASRASIKERLGRILGRDAAHDHHDHHDHHAQDGPVAGLSVHGEERRHGERHHGASQGLDAIRERLDALRARERPHAQHEAPGANLPAHGREQERTHKEQAHGLDPIRERLNAVLARARPVAHETPAHEQDSDTHRQRARGHGHEDDGHGWGL